MTILLQLFSDYSVVQTESVTKEDDPRSGEGGWLGGPDSTDQASQPFAAAQVGVTPATEHVRPGPALCQGKENQKTT